MIEFTTFAKHQIEGRGLVFVVPNPSQCRDFKHLIDQTVRVGGEPYRVRNVEYFSRWRPFREGEPISLVVTPVAEVLLRVPGLVGMERTGTLQELRELFVVEEAGHLFFSLSHPRAGNVHVMLEPPTAALRKEIAWDTAQEIDKAFAQMQSFLDQMT